MGSGVGFQCLGQSSLNLEANYPSCNLWKNPCPMGVLKLRGPNKDPKY